jgi:hypothetical protein
MDKNWFIQKYSYSSGQRYNIPVFVNYHSVNYVFLNTAASIEMLITIQQ